MPKLLSYDDVTDYLSSVGVTLISADYKGNKTPLDLKCLKCGKIYKQTLTNIKKGMVHPYCEFNVYLPKRINEQIRQQRMLQKRQYRMCKYELCYNYLIVNAKHKHQKFCSPECVKYWLKNSEEWKEKAAYYGSIGGKLSPTKNRSANEIHFAELCIDYFGEDHVLINSPIFDGFDTDVVIPSHKIAVEWNGVWHYKQVKQSHNLKQVQSRDKYKSKLIREKFEYQLYIIKDMGGINKKFVKDEFEKFLKYFNL